MPAWREHGGAPHLIKGKDHLAGRQQPWLAEVPTVNVSSRIVNRFAWDVEVYTLVPAIAFVVGKLEENVSCITQCDAVDVVPIEYIEPSCVRHRVNHDPRGNLIIAGGFFYDDFSTPRATF